MDLLAQTPYVELISVDGQLLPMHLVLDLPPIVHLCASFSVPLLRKGVESRCNGPVLLNLYLLVAQPLDDAIFVVEVSGLSFHVLLLSQLAHPPVLRSLPNVHQVHLHLFHPSLNLSRDVEGIGYLFAVFVCVAGEAVDSDVLLVEGRRPQGVYFIGGHIVGHFYLHLFILLFDFLFEGGFCFVFEE